MHVLIFEMNFEEIPTTNNQIAIVFLKYKYNLKVTNKDGSINWVCGVKNCYASITTKDKLVTKVAGKKKEEVTYEEVKNTHNTENDHDELDPIACDVVRSMSTMKLRSENENLSVGEVLDRNKKN